MVNSSAGVTDDFRGVVRCINSGYFLEFVNFFQKNAIVLSMFLYFWDRAVPHVR